MRFRKRPVIIEAFKLGIDDIPDWALFDDSFSLRTTSNELHTHALVETPEGTMRAELGDYIIKGVKDELYPCKPDIFEQTYEAVDNE